MGGWIKDKQEWITELRMREKKKNKLLWTIILFLSMSMLFMLTATFYSPRWTYYLVYIGVPVALILIYLTGYGNSYQLKCLPVICYYVFEIISEYYYLKYLCNRTFDGTIVLEYVMLFFCLAQIIRLALMNTDIRASKARWSQYCFFMIIILCAKAMHIGIEMDLNSLYSYRGFEFWGFFCFMVASALIVFPEHLAYNNQKIRKMARLFPFIVLIAVIVAIEDAHSTDQSTDPLLFSIMIFLFTFMVSCITLYLWVIVSSVIEIYKKGIRKAYCYTYLEEQLGERNELNEYIPIKYRNKDFYSEYVDSRFIYRRDTAERISDIQESLDWIQKELNTLVGELNSASPGIESFKKIRLRSLCIQQYDLLEELNYSYHMYIDIPDIK